jgi:hypothetical protein
MKMIFEETIRKRIRDGFNMPRVQVHKVTIVPLLLENILAVDAAIVNMKELTGDKQRQLLHSR